MSSLVAFLLLLSLATGTYAADLALGATCVVGGTTDTCVTTNLNPVCDAKSSPTKCAIVDGESCASNTDKCVTGATCTAGNVCACGNGYEVVTSSKLCKVTDGNVGGTCSGTIACGHRASCPSSGTKECACDTNFEATNGKSGCNVKDGFIGGPCTTDSNCGTNAYCQPSTPQVCLCKKNYKSSAGDKNCGKSGATSVAASVMTLLLSVITLRCFL